MEDGNKWCFVELKKERVGTDKDESDEERQLVLQHATIPLPAFAFERRKGERSNKGHHLVKLMGLPRPEQGEATSGHAWKVDCHWLNSVPTARHWCTKSLQNETVDPACVAVTNVGMKSILPASMMKSRAARQVAEQKECIKN